MISLYLSSDGKHTVNATADTPEQMNKLAPYARALYEKVIDQFGTKAQMWNGANGQSNGQTRRDGANGKADGQNGAGAPKCPVHGVPMAYREGRYGPFYSCKVRENGSWCDQTQRISQTNKQEAPSLHAQA